jgi:hypothetical protein
MDTFVNDPDSPDSPKIARPPHPTKTIFDKTKLRLEPSLPKTTTDGRKVSILAIFNCAKLRRFQLDMLRAAHL